VDRRAAFAAARAQQLLGIQSNCDVRTRSGLAPGGWAEVRTAVDALHNAGIAVILDVVFNHTGESDEFGPTLSMRGLDNAGFYRLQAGNPALYVNDAGCGNVPRSSVQCACVSPRSAAHLRYPRRS